MNSVLHARRIYKALITHEAALDAVAHSTPALLGTQAWDNLVRTKDELHRALNQFRRASVDWATFKALLLAGDDAQIAAALNDEPDSPQSGGTNKDDPDKPGG